MAEQSLKEKTAKGLFWGGISNGVQQILNLVFGLVLVRILDAKDYGMVGMLAIFSAIATTLLDSGFTSALANRKEIKDSDYNAVFWFSSIVGVFFYIVLFFCAPLIARFFGEPDLVGLSRLLFLGFLFAGFCNASSAYLFKTLMVKERAKIDILSLLCSGSAGIVLAINGFAYYGLALQTVVYIGLGSILKIYYSPWKPSFQFDFTPLKEMFGFSSKLILTNIFTQINNNVFSVILGKFYNVQLLGFYAQGQKWTNMGSQLIGGMINGVAQPVLVQVTNDAGRQRNIFRKMVRFGAFVSFPAMLGLAFVAREFVLIMMGEKWLPSVPFLQLFCFWGVIHYLWLLYTNLLIAYGKSDSYFKGVVYISLFQILVVIGLSFLGIYQMVIGYVLTYYIGIGVWHIYVNKVMKLSIFSIIKDVSSYFISVALSIIVAYSVVYWLENIYIIFFLKILIVALVYVMIMYFGKSVIFKESLSFILERLNKNK